MLGRGAVAPQPLPEIADRFQGVSWVPVVSGSARAIPQGHVTATARASFLHVAPSSDSLLPPIISVSSSQSSEHEACEGEAREETVKSEALGAVRVSSSGAEMRRYTSIPPDPYVGTQAQMHRHGLDEAGALAKANEELRGVQIGQHR